MHASKQAHAIWPVSLKRIEQTVAAHLGPGRVGGSAQPACFSRQVSMYLARHVGCWSLQQIGRFYNGRHHTTVLHAVEKIEVLKRSERAVDLLIEDLIMALAPEPEQSQMAGVNSGTRALLVDAVASRVIERLTGLERHSVPIVVQSGDGRCRS